MVIRGRGAFRPELPAEMKRLERLNGKLPYRVFENIEHYSGLSDQQLAALLDERPSRLAGALAQLNQGEDKERIATAVAPVLRGPRGRMRMLLAARLRIYGDY